MIKHINEADSHEWVVVDLQKGALIEHVCWANDRKRSYSVFEQDERGGPILVYKENSKVPRLKTCDKKGKILIVKSKEFHTRKSEFI